MAIEAVRVQMERQSGRSQLHRTTSRLLLMGCAQQGWLHVLFSVCVFGRDEVIGAMQQGLFPQRGGLGAGAVLLLRQKRKALEVD